MTDMQPTPAPAPSPAEANKDSASQAFIAALIVVGLVAIGLGAMVVAWILPGEKGAAFGVTATVVGGLINALNAPTGIANVIAQARRVMTPAHPQGTS